MKDGEQLRQIVLDLIGVMHLQAKELETLVEHVEQVAGHLGYRPQFSVIASELSELHVRIKKLGGLAGPGGDS
jgi:adenine deaminase